MIRTQVQLTDEQMARLRREAAERGISVSALIREAVDAHRADADLRARRERAIAAIGGFRSGLPDVGEDHDRYLAEDFEG